MRPTDNRSDAPFPESNVQSVVRALVLGTVDLDGTGLVDLLRMLVARAEELKSISARGARSFQAMLDGEEPITQEAINAQAQESLYETTCLKWFLTCALKSLGEHLEYDLHQNQSRFPKVKSVVYSEAGEVESFELETQ